MQNLFRPLAILFILTLSLSVMIGWIFNIKFLVVNSPSQVPMVFNGALCAFISGLALWLCHPKYERWQWLQIILGMALITIGGITLSQDIFGVDLGIDDLFVKSWFIFPASHMGRVAPNAAGGVILTGLVFVLLPFARSRLAAFFIEVLIFLIFLVGLLGLFGYLLKMEFLYSWYKYTRMSIRSSLVFIVLALGLWNEWRRNPKSYGWYESHYDKKILMISSMILLTIALLSGFTGFMSAIRHQNDNVSSTFQELLTGKIANIESQFSRVLQEITAVEANPLFQEAISHSKDNAKLDALLQLFISEGFSGVSLYDDEEEKIIATKGEFVSHPDLSVGLNMAKYPVLLWKNGWYLRVKDEVHFKKTLIAEWPLSEMNTIFKGNVRIAKTLDLLICTAAPRDRAVCFPSHLNPHVFSIKRIINGQPLPMDFALDGKTGAVTAYDYRDQRVLAAYSPLNRKGLGIVLKIDLREIYRPIIKSLNIILPLITLAIVIGILLLRFTVKPLIRKVINAEQELINSYKQLQESQERYDLAVAGSQVGVWDWEIDTGKVFYSPLLKKMLGYEENEITQSTAAFLEFLHPDDQLRAEQAIQEHIKNHVPYNIEFRLRNKQGEYLWFQVVGQALWNKQNHATRMSGSIMDITERKINQQQERALHAVTQCLSQAVSLEEVMPSVLEAICEGMSLECGFLWMADVQANKLLNKAYWINPAFHLQEFAEFNHHLQLSPGIGAPGIVWMSGKPIWICDPLDEIKFPRLTVLKSTLLHSSFCFPLILNSKVVGVVEFFSIEKKPPNKLVADMMTDVIGPQIGQFILRKTIEEELRASEAYKSAILESASDGIITIDEQGTIVSCNMTAENMFGYKEKILMAKNVNELMPNLLGKFRKINTATSLEVEGIRANGQFFPIEVSVSQILIENESRYIFIIRDITERKKMEGLKNEFVSVVSHELRTPLTSIRGSLGLILGGAVGTGFSEKAKKLLEIANSNCDRLLLLINDILDIEKIEAGKMIFKYRSVDLGNLIAETVNSNQFYAEKFSVHLQFQPPKTPIFVNVDPDRLVQVLVNLLSNAVKFSPSGGKVTIETNIENDRVIVSVCDEGIGIDEKHKSFIFQKFTQVDSSVTREKGGTGLGLAISKAIIEKLGGTLNFTSEPNVKTVFYFDLLLN